MLMIKPGDLWVIAVAVATVALLLLLISILFPEAR
jgi:hypothetical protein